MTAIRPWPILLVLLGLPATVPGAEQADTQHKKLVLIAGRRSHGYGSHEHYAGLSLLARLLKENMPNIDAAVHRGWPKEASAFDGASAIVI